MKNSFTPSSSDKLPSNKPSSDNPSSRKKALAVIVSGLVCLALDFAASWYAVAYNDSRLVAPMDFSEYAFYCQRPAHDLFHNLNMPLYFLSAVPDCQNCFPESETGQTDTDHPENQSQTGIPRFSWLYGISGILDIQPEQGYPAVHVFYVLRLFRVLL